MLADGNLEELRRNGFTSVSGVNAPEFEAIASHLGKPTLTRRGGSFVDTLRPQESSEAREGTISAQYGLSLFPWHSDGTVDPHPPRYVLLRAVEVSSTSARTEVLDLTRLNDGKFLRQYRRLTCMVDSGQGYYMASFLSQRSGVMCAKWDPLRMQPLGKMASSFVREIGGAFPHRSHAWARDDVLIVDNWRCLHRRTSADSSDPRVLQRIVVKSF
ncbi:TauD/TfdA dioxygenase family protein [Streptomyces sp. VNUA74]|uniref:TauD/TfdA dioxygenase family protein n=1 Tax=Streptomyces sp. VNUA74 TaxID=3062685 RepID=UPI0035B044ED